MKLGKWRVTFTRDFLVNGTLSPGEKAVVMALAGWANLRLEADPTKEQLSAGSGICKRQLWEHLQALRAKGFIDWQEIRIKGHRRNVYSLKPSCGICMMGKAKATMQFPHGSLIDRSHTVANGSVTRPF